MDKEQWEEMRGRILLLLAEQQYATKEDFHSLAEIVDKLSEQINHRDGPVSMIKQTLNEVQVTTNHVEEQQQRLEAGQKELIKSFKAFIEDRTKKEKLAERKQKWADRIVTIIVTLITAGAAIAGAILAL